MLSHGLPLMSIQIELFLFWRIATPLVGGGDHSIIGANQLVIKYYYLQKWGVPYIHSYHGEQRFIQLQVARAEIC